MRAAAELLLGRNQAVCFRTEMRTAAVRAASCWPPDNTSGGVWLRRPRPLVWRPPIPRTFQHDQHLAAAVNFTFYYNLRGFGQNVSNFFRFFF